MSFGPLIGPVSGEKQLTTGFENLVNGLTSCHYVYVKAASTNSADVVLQAKNASGPGTGYHLGSTDVALKLGLQYDNTLYRVRSTANGQTVYYIGSEE